MLRLSRGSSKPLRSPGHKPEPARILRSIDTEPLTYVELFSWGPEGMRPAHDQPKVAALWAKLAGCVQPRQVHQNVPGMSFPLYTEVTLGDG